ncbi:response regulator transcription factor [Adhaeretor mobilis]|uniref:Response regulator protein TmoT n=1 Tax=Adhaeretor mobilis TaxID=1930276 RepID=A0A517N1Z1_9BACT|nr:response regulator [Adhaeretor mobilis]QDT01157.1 Response regulator protein TmoT [Adhaeretor mobilis]
MSEKRISEDAVVYVVDDDPQACRAVSELVHTFGYQVRSYNTAEEFLENASNDRPGCVVLDLRMPEADGLELHRRMIERGLNLPVVIITAYAETSVTVKSIRSGAVSVLDKPYADDDLWTHVQEAICKSEKELRLSKHQASLEERLKRLSPQDRAVLQLMLAGEKNRTIAKRLDVSLRTVENRRRRVFDVMEADSVAQLTRMVVEYEHKLLPKKDSNEAWLALPFERVA